MAVPAVQGFVLQKRDKMQEEQINTDNQQPAAPDPGVKPMKRNRKSTRMMQDLLGGDYLSKERVVNNIPYVFYVGLLALVFIGNTYYTEKKFTDIEKTKSELKELRYQYITTKSALMFMGRQSEILRHATAIGLKESTLPPYKIQYSGKSSTTADSAK